MAENGVGAGLWKRILNMGGAKPDGSRPDARTTQEQLNALIQEFYENPRLSEKLSVLKKMKESQGNFPLLDSTSKLENVKTYTAAEIGTIVQAIEELLKATPDDPKTHIFQALPDIFNLKRSATDFLRFSTNPMNQPGMHEARSIDVSQLNLKFDTPEKRETIMYQLALDTLKRPYVMLDELRSSLRTLKEMQHPEHQGLQIGETFFKADELEKTLKELLEIAKKETNFFFDIKQLIEKIPVEYSLRENVLMILNEKRRNDGLKQYV